MGGENTTVVVLSPDDDVTNVLLTILQPHGVHVTFPRTSEGALEAIARSNADVVLVSSECGDEVLGTIVKEEFDPFVPVLLFSPHSNLSSLHTMAQRHGVPFLELSSDSGDLASRLRLAAGRQPLS